MVHESRQTIPREFRAGELIPVPEAKRWLEFCGRGVKLFRGCRIIHAKRVQVGDFSQIDEGVFIFGGQGVTLGKHVHLASGSSITGGGRCSIRDFAGIGAGVRMITGSEVIDGTGLTNPTVPASLRGVQRGTINIGAHAVVFTNTIVMPNVTIGEGAIVAAGSVVHHDLKPWSIYAGNPLVKVGVRPSKTVLELARALTKKQGDK